MKKFFAFVVLLTITLTAFCQSEIITSPDGKLSVSVSVEQGKPVYSVNYNGVPMLETSPLGLITTAGNFADNMKFLSSAETKIDKTYSQAKIKKSRVHYVANERIYSFSNARNQKLDIIFRVSNNDIAFRYYIHRAGNPANCIIEKEVTGFNFPEKTTVFLTPQATPMIGWERTKPSYEEDYIVDAPLDTPSLYGVGFTFPGLFRIDSDGWVLVSETGVTSTFCGSKLSEGTKDGLYTIAYPEPGENNGLGSHLPAISLPGYTPWRTVTVGSTLKPIVETTVPFDVVEPLYEPSIDYRFGRSTWSWIMWQDNSINYNDQVQYIDLAAAMGWEYVLIDGLWDKNPTIGYERMPELVKYAQSKGIDVFIWYNSNGYWNNAPQGPKNRMHNAIVRKKEMKWLQSMGVKGLKVDFFGGDKQETMKLYEDILSDANDYGLMIIFHGCTLPRGWERMYPNYVGSEAVLASENLIFNQRNNDMEAFNACLHPFIRNTVGSMEFGPVLLNKRHNRTNDGGNTRRTSDVFQLVTSVLFQNPVQMFAIAPNNLTDAPAFAIDFMKNVPTTWDETVFIDGYPGKYVVLARRHDEKWFLVGANAQKEVLNLKIQFPDFAGKTVTRYADDKNLVSFMDKLKLKKNGEISVVIQPNGGIILTEN